MKEKIEKAMKYHLISSKKEALEAIEFVRDLLEIDIEYTNKNYLYATESIREMRIAVNRVSDLPDDLLGRL